MDANDERMIRQIAREELEASLRQEKKFSILDDTNTLHVEGVSVLMCCTCRHYLVDHAPYPTLERCTKCRGCQGYREVAV